MRYLIGTILLGFVVILSLAIGYCVYMAFADNIYWILVAVGLFMPYGVGILATTAAFSAARQY